MYMISLLVEKLGVSSGCVANESSLYCLFLTVLFVMLKHPKPQIP